MFYNCLTKLWVGKQFLHSLKSAQSHALINSLMHLHKKKYVYYFASSPKLIFIHFSVYCSVCIKLLQNVKNYRNVHTIIFQKNAEYICGFFFQTWKSMCHLPLELLNQ